ncbi:hypothetical protein JCGZ_26790 [Jatropha curcas]|uniref:Prolamin-like domain-containing protein n=1 Tax=Jatropha curcas TaxID=180498 RepID=A0A067L043_JATCU|nr:hypothetical protein JCGZ_26790 [Jatropha curcas]
MFKTFCFVVVILSLSNVAIAFDFQALSPSPSPSPSQPLEEWLRIVAFSDKCSRKVSPGCGREIFNSVFKGGIATAECCVELVSMGKACYDQFVAVMAKNGPIFEAHLPEFLAKRVRSI